MPASGISVITEELRKLWTFLGRGTVQRQVVAFALAFLLAWLLTDGLRFFLGHRYREWLAQILDDAPRKVQRRVAYIIAQLGFPALSILLLTIVLARFEAAGWSAGLLEEGRRLLEAILIYRGIVATLYILIGRRQMRLYHHRLVVPALAVIIFKRVLGLVISIDAVASVSLFQIGEKAVSLGAVITASLVLYFVFTSAWVAQSVLQSLIIPRTDAEPGLVNAGLTIGRYVVIIVGVSLALSALGVNTSSITFISGGLSVGIAFGSQQVFGNLAAGILLLFEQSLRPGDVVNVAGVTGTVISLSIRSTTLRTPEDVVVVVPNQSVLASALRNYTKESPRTRISVKTIVLYDGDPQDVARVLMDAAMMTPGVLAEPQPSVYFGAFTKGKVPAELLAWLADAKQMDRLTSDLNLTVRNALLEHGFEIA